MSEPTPLPPRESREDCKARWSKVFQPLVGRTIRAIRYMTEVEAGDMDWHDAPIVIQLDDGTFLWPSADDEGNGAGALFLMPSKAAKQRGVQDCAPVI